MQLGRATDKLRQPDDKVNAAFHTSKRIFRDIARFDKLDKCTELMPNQVPNIPSPTISYQSYDVTPLAGSVKPLADIERSLSDLTLHYALEQFHGLYDSFKILTKVRPHCTLQRQILLKIIYYRKCVHCYFIISVY
jgi:hypothetical protein